MLYGKFRRYGKLKSILPIEKVVDEIDSLSKLIEII